MEKSAYSNPKYPHMPSAMSSSGNGSEEMPQMQPAPPTYDQATGSSTSTSSTAYPAVQVLPTPRTHDYNRVQQTPAPAPAPPQNPAPPRIYTQATYPTTTAYVTQQGAPPVVQQQPVVIIHQQAPCLLPLGPEPAYITCPGCHMQKLTRIEYEPSARTHLMAAVLCLLGLWCCVCLPYCAGSCMNTNHYCGVCNKFLGTYGNGL